jgi:hypothetical protein
MVTKGYRKGVYERVTLGIRGGRASAAYIGKDEGRISMRMTIWSAKELLKRAAVGKASSWRESATTGAKART